MLDWLAMLKKYHQCSTKIGGIVCDNILFDHPGLRALHFAGRADEN